MKRVIDRRFGEKFLPLEHELTSLYERGLLSHYHLFQAMKDDLIGLQLDSLTQLLARTPWYVEFKDALLRICPKLGQLEDMSPSDALRFLKKLQPKLKQLTVFAGDMAFLNVANEHGQHNQGDELLSSIGEAFLDGLRQFDGALYVSRPGGDEFCIFSVGIAESVMTLFIKEFLSSIRRIEIPNLQKYGLEPSMDFGSASVSEACGIMIALLERGESIHKNYFDFLINTTVHLADKRSSLMKIKNRIPLLLSLRERLDPHDYQHLSPSLKKGACGISEDFLSVLAAFFLEDRKLYEQQMLKFVLREVRKGCTQDISDDIINKALEPWEKKPFWWQKFF